MKKSTSQSVITFTSLAAKGTKPALPVATFEIRSILAAKEGGK